MSKLKFCEKEQIHCPYHAEECLANSKYCLQWKSIFIEKESELLQKELIEEVQNCPYFNVKCKKSKSQYEVCIGEIGDCKIIREKTFRKNISDNLNGFLLTKEYMKERNNTKMSPL